MKKLITTIIIAILVLALTACGSSNTTANRQQFNSSQSGNATTAELSLASKLIIGSFKLEKTDNAITAKQAADLLPLWQVYQQLSTSDTAAQEEITALAEQIQETMTADQMKAIDEMNLTSQDIFATMQEQGVTGQNGATSAQNGSGNGGNGEFRMPAGGDIVIIQGGSGAPVGGPGGGPGGGGSGLSPDQIATAQARRTANGGSSLRLNSTPAPLIEALVKLLQEKAGS
jgi:uncharacterized lipoprotein YehR (DUF1307 family)